jgi:polysaccharide export outer membrane protein
MIEANLKTFGKVIATLLMLGIAAAAQTNQTSGHDSAWSAGSSAGAGLPAVAPIGGRTGLPVVTPQLVVAPHAAPDLIPSLNPMATTMTSGPVKLGPGDLVDIGVFASPELTARVRVPSEGDISFPLLGKLHVSGMMPEEVQDLIRDQLMKRDFVKDPEVSVFVLEYANQTVYVLGEVTRPGAYPVLGSHSLSDYLSVAGGFTPRAGKTITVTRRDHPDTPNVVQFSRAPNLSGTNPQVNAGDSIYVGQAGLVYVVGDVTRPGGFVLDSDQKLTVMKALALAEGTKPTASLKGARLVRMTGKGREEIPIDLKKIFQAKAADPELQDQDIVYVPISAGHMAANRGMDALQAVSGAAIYRF